MWFGQREPLHIILLYPAFIYTASTAVARLGLTERCEAAGVALFVLIFDMPYDIMGIKFLWWTWHDTDSNIYDRMYWVPWTSYYFHMSFALAFNLINHAARRYFVGLSGLYSVDDLQRMPYARQIVANNWWGEFKALVVTGLFSMPVGVLFFVPGYHFWKDALGVHAEVTTTIFGSILGVVFFYGLMHNHPVNYLEQGERELRRGHKMRGAGKWYVNEVMVGVVVHFVHYMVLVLVADPSKVQAIGMHQEQGFPPSATNNDDEARGCQFQRNLTYPYPFTDGAFWPFRVEVLDQLGLPKPWFLPLPTVEVTKRPYICPYGKQLFDEKIISFNTGNAAAQKWVGNAHQWYWMSGTDWTNHGTTSHQEYVLVIWAICLLGLNLYAQAFSYPRTLYEQFFELREFPRYYKTNEPETIVAEFEDRRFNPKDGREEFLVKRVDAKTNEVVGESWERRDDLVQDAVGPVYAERGGLYGVFHDSYGKSTFDRLRLLDSLTHAKDRIALFERRASRRPVSGIAYDEGFARAGDALGGAGGVGAGGTDSGGAQGAKRKTGRSKTPDGKKRR